MNPFAGWPVSDYVRDGVALVALLTALNMPWDLRGDSSDRWWVIIAILVSAASLAVPYIGRAGLIPGWTRQHLRLTKLAMFVPMLASVLAGLVNELIHVGDSFDGGVGSGVAVALFGGVMAVSPRAADEEPNHPADPLWVGLTKTSVVGALLLGIATFGAFFIEDLTGDGYLLDDIPTLLAIVLAFPVMFAVVAGAPGVGTVSLRVPSRRVFVVVGATVLTAAVMATSNDGAGLIGANRAEKWDTPVAGLFVLAAATALATCWPMHRITNAGVSAPAGWLATARLAVTVSGAGLARPRWRTGAGHGRQP